MPTTGQELSTGLPFSSEMACFGTSWEAFLSRDTCRIWRL